MDLFINYDPQEGLSVNNYRKHGYYADIDNVVEALRFKKEYPVSCAYEGALDALEDGSLWKDGDKEAIEELHDFLKAL